MWKEVLYCYHYKYQTEQEGFVGFVLKSCNKKADGELAISPPEPWASAGHFEDRKIRHLHLPFDAAVRTFGTTLPEEIRKSFSRTSLTITET
jgi:hypothetical protein